MGQKTKAIKKISQRWLLTFLVSRSFEKMMKAVSYTILYAISELTPNETCLRSGPGVSSPAVKWVREGCHSNFS